VVEHRDFCVVLALQFPINKNFHAGRFETSLK
jgi:hypothetical protein